MPVDVELLEILACPSPDHAPLRQDLHEDREELVCTFCGTRFPVRDGIPVLLVDDAVPGPHGIGHDAAGRG